jgi:GDPmannose 4,6-dehydratase
MKTAVVTGAGGQDGSYLVEFLLDKGYEVYALYRPSAVHSNRMPNTRARSAGKFHEIYGDLLEESTIRRLVNGSDEFYHLAALSHVGESFEHPELTMQVNFNVTVKLLERLRQDSPGTKFYFAGTSETLADACSEPKLSWDNNYSWGMTGSFTMNNAADETSPWSAHSPYAVSKVAAQSIVRVYREAYGMYAVNGLSFNHESPRRGPNFVTAKIVDKLIKRKKHGGNELVLGKDTYRDWHHARDTIRGMWLSLQQDKARDYCFASGQATSVSEFAKIACEQLGLCYEESVSFKEGIVEARPWDVDYLCGDPSMTEELLGWKAEISLEGLVKDMILERGRKKYV